MTALTKRDTIEAAMNLAEDVAEGRLDVADLERQAAKELRSLILVETQPDSDLAVLQVHSARRVLARGGIPTDELAEWLAVQRRRENLDATPTDSTADPEPVVTAGGVESGAPAVAGSRATEAHSAEYEAESGDPEPDGAEAEPDGVAPGCGCAAHTVERGPRFGGTVLARGRGLPDTGLLG